MATIHVFRHAESMHNVDEEQTKSRDPVLSPAGRQQCMDFSQQFPFMNGVTHVVSSPLRRAIESSLLAFSPALAEKQVIVLPEVTETGNRPLVSDPAVQSFWIYLDPLSPYAYEIGRINTRMIAGRRFLIELASTVDENAHIIVMTHGQSAHFLTDDFDGPKSPDFRCVWDGNLTYRSYKVDLITNALIETPESRARRGAPMASTIDEATKDTIKGILTQRIKVPPGQEAHDGVAAPAREFGVPSQRGRRARGEAGDLEGPVVGVEKFGLEGGGAQGGSSPTSSVVLG
ncbi:hypothetical protein F4818DRAFT_436001 [Hypoxylon cercidicola]|nr:hypothetical protein F4818DRAFT_436001 [Hypoxylon cercidicola]